MVRSVIGSVARPTGVALALLASATACSEQPPCGERACPEGTVCQLDGTCRPLARGPVVRFARTRELPALDWAVTHTERPTGSGTDGDTLELGGAEGAVVYLRFGPVPEGAPDQAVLVLTPHPSWSGPGRVGRLVVYQTGRFEGDAVNEATRPMLLSGPVVEQAFGPGFDRPLRLDVTPALRQSYERGERYVSLRISISRGSDGRAWRLASPRTFERDRRPRLELLLR